MQNAGENKYNHTDTPTTKQTSAQPAAILVLAGKSSPSSSMYFVLGISWNAVSKGLWNPQCEHCEVGLGLVRFPPTACKFSLLAWNKLGR